MHEIDLHSLTDETFAELCHALLNQEHGECYRPIDGRGGDHGIDGFIEDNSIIYQFKFFKAHPRPATFLKDINKVAKRPNLKCWILVIPGEPTPKLYELIAKENANRPFNVDIRGKTWLLTLLDKHEFIRERFFPKVAKEASVQKVIDLDKYRAKKSDKQHKEIKRSLRKIERGIETKKSKKISVEKPVDSLTPEHIRDITDEIKRIVKVSKEKESFSKVLARLKNKYRVSNWHLIKDICYGDIMAWLHRYYHGVREEYESPMQLRRKYQGIIKSQQKEIGLKDKKYREMLLEMTGKTSTTQMDIEELEYVIDRFNIVLGLNKRDR